MSRVISPWASTVRLMSMDGRRWAEIGRADEIGMGAPTSGTLLTSAGIVLEGCNPSMVWSDDERSLAVPQWTVDERGARVQRLAVVSFEHGTVFHAPGSFRVLELHEFTGGVIRGVDSPAFQPKPVAVDLRHAEGL